MNFVVTDLDRTLLDDRGEISDRNYKALKKIDPNNYIFAIATGRNLYSSYKVLPADLPLDYLIFSSGSGIMKWKDRELLNKRSLPERLVVKAIKVLRNYDVDFMIHSEIPDNHRFLYFDTGRNNPDFYRRMELYNDFAAPLVDEEKPGDASQLIAVIPEDDFAKFALISQELDFVKVIRATSPLDHKTIWLEIFPENISKGHALEWLCKELNLLQQNTYSLGNDYNDIDMLEWTSVSYVVANAPVDLQQDYPVTRSNQEDGFAHWLENVVFNLGV